jgi:peptide deformylase
LGAEQEREGMSVIERVPGQPGARLLHFPEDAVLLRREAKLVPEGMFGTPGLRALCQTIGVVMLSNRGAGLAATQVDTDPALRVIVIGENQNVWMALCNPVVVRLSGVQKGPEGCLSFGSVQEPMEAPGRLVVRYRDPDGRACEVECEGFRARAVWHETRHLDGSLLIDRMGTLQRTLFLKQVAKARKAKSPS